MFDGSAILRVINGCLRIVIRRAISVKHRICRREITLDEAYDLLEAYSPNPKTSCFFSGMTNPSREYDLTVIVPTYNNAAFLKRCLDSIFSQKSEYDVEVIIVNDGSTDHTAELLCGYESMPAVTIINQPNTGLSGARNSALDISKGKFITFVDADDRLTEGAIQKLLSTAFSYNADVVAGNHAVVRENGKLIKEMTKYQDAVVRPQGTLSGYAWGKLFRSDIFDHLRFPVGYWFEDSIMAQIVWPLVEKVYTISDVVYEYTANPKGITATARKKPKAIDSLYITQELLKDKKFFGLTLTNADLDYFLSMVGLTYRRTCKCSAEIAKAIFVVQCELYKQFSGLKSDKNISLQKALENVDYRKYIHAVCKQ